jgi:hypothetical protein
MQVSARILPLSRHELPSNILIEACRQPAPLAAATALGVLVFRRINEAAFRRIILLPASGLSLVV